MRLDPLAGALASVLLVLLPLGCASPASGSHAYNEAYSGEHLDRVAFPIGGIGAGMVCLEGTGALSHVSVRNRMDVFHEPLCFAASTTRDAGSARRAETSASRTRAGGSSERPPLKAAGLPVRDWPGSPAPRGRSASRRC